jgi:hypothetical protein
MRAELIFEEAKSIGKLGFGTFNVGKDKWSISRLIDVFIGVNGCNPFKRKDLQFHFDNSSREDLVKIVANCLTNEKLKELSNKTGISEDAIFSKLSNIYSVYILMSLSIQEDKTKGNKQKEIYTPILIDEDEYDEDLIF